MKVITDAGVRPRVNGLSLAIAELVRSSRAAAAGGALLASALAIVPVNSVVAQDQQDEQALEEVVVTGSRIVRQDFSANSPITTIDETSFENTSAISVETVLNQLPQFVPAFTQFTTGDVQQTATNSVGASRLSLRGLGPNRNLVLVNGRRATPIDGTMVVDTNSIPASAIARVETITGGASAVYGADAVGGVVNFILKDDFEGASVDVRFGDTEQGGNQTVEFASLLGANVADNRGNVMLGLEYSSRTKVENWQRDWRLDEYRNKKIGGGAFFATETYISNPNTVSGSATAPPCTTTSPTPTVLCQNNVSQAAVNAVFDQRVPGTTVPNTGTNFFINRTPNGTGSVFTGLSGGTGQLGPAGGAPEYLGSFGGFDANGIEYHPDFPGLPFRHTLVDGRITENTFYQWSSSPLDRYSAFGRGTFDVSDNVSVVAQAMFTKTNTQSSLGLTSDAVGVHGAPFPYGPEAYLPSFQSLGPDGLPFTGDGEVTNAAFLPGGRYGLDCNADGTPGCSESEAWPVPPEIAFLMNSRPQPNMDLQINRPLDFLRSAQDRARGSDVETSIYNLMVGLEGSLGEHSWDMNLSSGATDSLTRQRGVGKLEMWRDIIGSPNFGMGFIAAGNPAGGGFQSGLAQCTTGLPVVRNFTPSDDCLVALGATLHNTQTVEQNVFEANLAGTLAEMRSGPLQYSVGTGYRDASILYTPDQLVANDSINETVMGLFPQWGYGGEFDVSDLYGELLVPIVNDGPAMVEHFTVELGARVSDFSTVGAVDTWKAMIDWGFFPQYRLRGGVNRAHRAPNLAELYSVRSQVFSIFGAPAIFGDQCSLRNPGPYSANVGADPASPMTNVNGLAGAQATQALCRQLMGPIGAAAFYDNRALSDHPASAANIGFGLGQPNTTGSTSLKEEQADTFTLGIAMEFLEAFRMTVDYYTIEIEDMIAVETGDAVMERCLSPAFNPSRDPNAPACLAQVRNPFSGGASSVDLTFTNLGAVKFSGVDVSLNWSEMYDFGGLGVNLQGNYNIESQTRENPRANWVDWKGTAGCALQMQCQGYEYRLFTTMNYFNGPFAISLTHQYWPTLKNSLAATNPATTQRGVEQSYQLFSVAGSYQFGERYTLRVGIENLLDEIPPLSSTPTAQNAPAALGGPWETDRTRLSPGFGGGTYDPLGRRGYISVTMDF